MAKILSGIEVAKSIIDGCAESVSTEITKTGFAPKLSIVNIGQDCSNNSYIKGISKKAAEAGVLISIINFDLDANKEQVLDKIRQLNDDDKINGILLMRPFPDYFKDIEYQACQIICPNKDVDAASDISVSGSFLYKNTFNPCTAESCIKILDYYKLHIEGKHVVIVGRSMVVGKPLANMLLNRDATVTVCHSKTENIKSIIKSADIVITACGVANKFDSNYFNEDQVIIDAGINWDEDKNKICGDVDFDSTSQKVFAITPVPGGVGAVTSAVLISHVV